jgi:anti-anti-sigma factor
MQPRQRDEFEKRVAVVTVRAMPIEKWSDKVNVLHLADDPQFSDDLASLEAQTTAKPADAVLDFAAVHFINSSNIARLLRMRKLMITKDRRLMVCGVSTQVWGTFLVTGLDKVFSFSDNVTTALATLQMN